VDNGGRIEGIIIDFLNAFVLVPHDQLLTKLPSQAWILE
jgi:tetrahydromethanopterin S-methyltransferase subunit F